MSDRRVGDMSDRHVGDMSERHVGDMSERHVGDMSDVLVTACCPFSGDGGRGMSHRGLSLRGREVQSLRPGCRQSY